MENISRHARVAGPLKEQGPDDWREKYRAVVEAQCARELMLKCPACGWIHVASHDPSAAGRVQCFSCCRSHADFVRASIDDVLQIVGAAAQVIAMPPQFANPDASPL